MSKRIAALLAAMLSTACIGIAMLAVGGAALFTPNGTVAVQSPAQASAVAASSGSSQTQVQQLQALVAQYQNREQQYQAREHQLQQQLQNARDQVQQAQQQMQEVRSLLIALQQRGLISITGDGQIVINTP